MGFVGACSVNYRKNFFRKTYTALSSSVEKTKKAIIRSVEGYFGVSALSFNTVPYSNENHRAP
jgi:hypothetical protein